MKEIQKYPYNAIIGEENKIFLSDQVCKQVAGFNKETGDIITAGKYRPRAFGRFLDTKHLGRL